jgi:Down-regulated in metastasis
MIPIIVFGSQEGPTESLEELEAQDEKRESKRNIKGQIPKLEKEDRKEVLPFIVKLLFSKLLAKKGAINKKNVDTRRNIVYQFLSGFDPATEFHIFFRELLEPLGIEHVLDSAAIDESDVKLRLAQNSLGQLFNFIASLQVVFKQLGNLLAAHNQLLTKLAHVLVLTVTLGKQFMGHLKAE